MGKTSTPSDLGVQQRQARQVFEQTVEQRGFAEKLHVELVHKPHAAIKGERRKKKEEERMKPTVNSLNKTSQFLQTVWTAIPI